MTLLQCSLIKTSFRKKLSFGFYYITVSKTIFPNGEGSAPIMNFIKCASSQLPIFLFFFFFFKAIVLEESLNLRMTEPDFVLSVCNQYQVFPTAAE